MKYILSLILVLCFVVSKSQVLQEPNIYGYKFKRSGSDTLHFIPSDTLRIPTQYNGLSFIANKGGKLYYWNGVKWILFSEGSSYTFTNGLTEIGGTVRWDSVHVYNELGTKADSLRRSGLAVQMRKNGNLTTQFNLPDSVSTSDSTPVKILVHNKRMFFISDTWDTTWSAGRGSTQDILIGDGAGNIGNTGDIKGIIAIGDSSLSKFTVSSKWAWGGQMALGHYAGQYNTTGVIQATGWQSLRFNTTGFRNVGCGPSTGRNNITGGYNWYGGQFAGEWATSKSGQTFTGALSGRGGGGENDSYYGGESGLMSSGSITGVTITNGGSGYTTASVTFSSPLNPPVGYNLSVTATGTAIISGGAITGVTMTNIGLGYNAAHTHTVTITGDGAGATATPILDFSGYNTGTGAFSLHQNKIGKYRTATGWGAGRYGTQDTGTTDIGANAGKLATVSENITNATAIGYNAKTSKSNTISLGDTTVKTKVGVGTTQPTTMIDVRTTSDDGIRIDMPSKGSGKVLISDVNGVGVWKYDTCTLVTFSGGGRLIADTSAFTDSTIYGSFYNDGNDTLIITKLIAVMNGGTSDTLGVQVYFNDSVNVMGSTVATSTLACNSTTTGNSTTTLTSYKIPPGNWVWCKTPVVVAGRKPYYLSASLIGYKKRI